MFVYVFKRINMGKKKKKKKKFEKYFMSYCPLSFWAFLPWQQNISKTVQARAFKLGELIGNDEWMT